MGGELLSFDEALAELQMATHELRSLVAQGEIRAFRDEDVLKFRRTDILDLKKTRETQQTDTGMVIEPEGASATQLPDVQIGVPPGVEVKPAKHETEETELLAGIGQGATIDFLGLDETAPPETGDTAQTVIPTIEIADDDIVDDTSETIVPGLSAEVEAPETEAPIIPSLLADEEESTEMATQEVATQGAETEMQLGFRRERGEEELGIATEEVPESPKEAPKRRGAAAAVAEIPEGVTPPLWLALVIATFVILILAVPIFYGMATDTAPNFNPYKSFIQFLAQKTVHG